MIRSLRYNPIAKHASTYWTYNPINGFYSISEKIEKKNEFEERLLMYEEDYKTKDTLDLIRNIVKSSSDDCEKISLLKIMLCEKDDINQEKKNINEIDDNRDEIEDEDEDEFCIIRNI